MPLCDGLRGGRGEERILLHPEGSRGIHDIHAWRARRESRVYAAHSATRPTHSSCLLGEWRFSLLHVRAYCVPCVRGSGVSKSVLFSDPPQFPSRRPQSCVTKRANERRSDGRTSVGEETRKGARWSSLKVERGIGIRKLLSRIVYCKPTTILLRGGPAWALKLRARNGDGRTERAVALG